MPLPLLERDSMRIPKWVEFSKEIEIDLTSEDINVILEESETLRGLLYNINTILQFLKGVPDKLIDEFNDGHRKIIINAFEEIIAKMRTK